MAGGIVATVGKKVTGTIVGVLLFVAWMQLRGGGGGGGAPLDTLPGDAFGGGAGTVSIEMTTNQPAQLVAHFSRVVDRDDREEETIDAQEDLAPGTYTRSIDVAPDTYVYFELGVPEATPGAELSWVVRLDGREVTRESDRLEQPLGSGYAFFLQLEAEGGVEEMRQWR